MGVTKTYERRVSCIWPHYQSAARLGITLGEKQQQQQQKKRENQSPWQPVKESSTQETKSID